MGIFLDKFRNVDKLASGINNKANDYYNKQNSQNKPYNHHIKEKSNDDIIGDVYDGIDEFGINEFGMEPYNKYGVGIQPAQKPESFHHFILENQYKDLEKSIRGYKDVYNKETREWETKRKDSHCFTDEEAEEVLRTTQSHLATDIKLSFINKDVFGLMMTTIYKRLDELFYSISEYRYGRYSHDANGKEKEGGYQKEYEMKLQNRKIFLELWSRVQANYSRAIQGAENRATHNSVQAQESLQGRGNGMDSINPRRYT